MREYILYAKDLIKEAEGFSAVIYTCPSGYPTIGYGRNLSANPLSEAEKLKTSNRIVNGKTQMVVSKNLADEWLTQEVVKIASECEGKEWFEYLGFERKGVVIDMIYNIGMSRWNGFKKCQSALKDKDFGRASLELMDSKWYKQVGYRGKRNVEIMKFGEKIHDFYKGEKV